MPATFDPSLPTLKDHIRLALGDRHHDATAGPISSPLLADETIQAKLDTFDYPEALAQLAESLISEFGQRPDEYSESGGIKISWRERIAAWQKIVDAARSGGIKTPANKRISRPRAAVAETTKQAATTTHPMTAFRSD